MIEKIISTFAKPSRHRASSEIIRRHSTNREDVREVALSNIDLGSVHDVLDLGCGFGFMAEVIAARVAPDARFLGIDACSENSSSYLECVKASGRDCEFSHYQISDTLPWGDRSFDLVLASYSLYFFTDIIPEIVRVLRPGGIFITITHFLDSFSELYRAANLSEKDTPMFKLISRFPAENGEKILTKYFTSVERIDYCNMLNFRKKDLKDLLEYTRFKLPLMALGPDLRDRSSTDVNLPPKMERTIKDTLLKEKELNINKCDAVFRCRGPIWP